MLLTTLAVANRETFVNTEVSITVVLFSWHLYVNVVFVASAPALKPSVMQCDCHSIFSSQSTARPNPLLVHPILYSHQQSEQGANNIADNSLGCSKTTRGNICHTASLFPQQKETQIAATGPTPRIMACCIRMTAIVFSSMSPNEFGLCSCFFICLFLFGHQLSCSFWPRNWVPVTRTGDSGPRAPEPGSGPERDERGAHGSRHQSRTAIAPRLQW
jgi:hypothetical protein